MAENQGSELHSNDSFLVEPLGPSETFLGHIQNLMNDGDLPSRIGHDLSAIQDSAKIIALGISSQCPVGRVLSPIKA